MACAEHRLRYGRLGRLPTVRVVGAAAVATLVAAVLVALVGAPLAALVVLLVGAGATTGYGYRHRASLTLEVRLIRALTAARGCPGDGVIAGLSGRVDARVRSDGVTEIEAGSWADAIRALGDAMGRDRGFQLDLLRRTAAGQLAQVWGRVALPADRQYRALALAPAANRAADALEAPERELLEAFTEGVNAAWQRHGAPYECRFLGYRPAPWKPADSLLIALLMYHSLSWNEPAKRADKVTRAALSPPFAAFLLPGADDVPLPPGLADQRAAAPAADGIVLVDQGVAGSNGWVRGGLLAGDLHLPLAMPNTLYEVDLRWPGGQVRGLAAAGLPVVLVGTNGRLSWTVTNLGADVLDLPPVTGPRETRTERIQVRGRPDDLLETELADGRPVSARPLLGQPVALRWAGYDPRSLDLKFQRLAGSATVADGLAILDDAAGIALNVLLTDAAGSTAHAATGLLPRPGGGFLTGAERPRLVDPAEGFLVSANDATLPEGAASILYDPDPGYRARRLRKLVAGAPATGPAMRELQHDLDAEAYADYRDLAVAALRGRDDALADLLAGWDGTATAGSRAFGVLVGLRQLLAQQVLAPYLTACRELDPAYVYPFQMVDRPLLAILRRRDPSLLPRAAEADGWDAFMVSAVRRAAGVRWENAVGLRHPMESLAPWAAGLIGVASRSQPGALHVVRTCVPGFGSAGRAVFTTGRPGYAAVDLPGGQSGHPLSPHFTDRHDEWSEAPPSARRTARARCGYVLRPASAGRPGEEA